MSVLSVTPGAGFSRNRRTRPVVVDLDDAERRWIGDGREVERRVSVALPMFGDQCRRRRGP